MTKRTFQPRKRRRAREARAARDADEALKGPSVARGDDVGGAGHRAHEHESGEVRRPADMACCRGEAVELQGDCGDSDASGVGDGGVGDFAEQVEARGDGTFYHPLHQERREGRAALRRTLH